MIILDFGSGNTCRNQNSEIRDMIAGLADVDTQRQSIIKWQLFDEGEPQCLRLTPEAFSFAYRHAERRGFRTTASVFDLPSLKFLLKWDIPFVKLSNRKYLRHLSRYVPRGLPIVWSYPIGEQMPSEATSIDLGMFCVSQYPAQVSAYEFAHDNLSLGVSDHTEGMELWERYHPMVYEKHYRLPDSTGPDALPLAATPEDLECFIFRV